MDPQVVLVGVAVFVVSALLIYLISVFGIKEKSYEEAIAEQRRRMEEEQEKQRKDKKAEKDKKKKKSAKEKPPKEKPPIETPMPMEPVEAKEQKMVNLEIDPEIIEPLTAEKHSQKPSKKKTAKPILHNKDEKPFVAKETQEVIHHIQTPKDDLELKHLHDKERKGSKKSERQKSDSPRELKKESEIKKERKIEDEIFVEKLSKQMAAAPSFDDRAGARKNRGVVEKSVVDTQALIGTVRNAQLNDQDTQKLIDILLNKQGGGGSLISTEWNKKVQKGDPVALLRKQLEEKERSLQEEQQLAMANHNKCKEMKAEMTKEKARYTSLETQYQEKIAAQTQEIQALHSKMRSTHDNHLIESSKMQAHVQQLERQLGDGSRLQTLKEENQVLKDTIEKMKVEAIPVAEFNSLRQKVSIMENELSSNVTKLSSAEKAKKVLEQKCTKLEDDIKKTKTSENQTEGVWSKRLEEVKQQLKKTEADKASLTGKLTAAEKDCATVKARLQELEKTLSANDSKDLEEKLKSVEKAKTASESSLKVAEQKLTETEQQRVSLQKELEKLKQENYTLTTEMKTFKERQVGDGQETPQKADGKQNGDIHTSEKETEIQKLIAEVESKKKEVSSLQEQMEIQKKKNNELREKNWKAMDALEKAEKSASDKIQSTTKDFKMQLSTVVEEAEKNDQTVLQRLFPDISIGEKKSHKDWMMSFEKQISVYLSSLSNKSNDSTKDSAKVTELEEKNKTLQSQIQDVQNRLSTESAKCKEMQEETKKLETQLQESKNVISSKTTESESRITELASCNKTIQSQTEKLKSLEDSNKKLQSDLEKAKSLEQQVNQLTSQLANQRAEIEKQNNSSENRISELENEKKVLQVEVEELKVSAINQGANNKSSELEAENKKLQSQIEEYLAVLKVTETKLQQLENSVEGEEKKWQDRTETLQLDLHQAKEELEALREQMKKLQGSEEALTELDFAYRCLEKSLTQITDEMEEKVLNLERELKNSEEKCSLLQSQVDEAEARISNLQLTIEKTTQSDNDDLLKQIAELKATLASEQKKSKELAMQAVKLNGIIKTGHDALTQEQNLVKKLQEQIEANQKNSGTSNSKEVSELKLKLADKEKQLDRELTSNKQLSQRLAQLGVMTSSQSSLNEAGTSV